MARIRNILREGLEGLLATSEVILLIYASQVNMMMLRRRIQTARSETQEILKRSSTYRQ